MLDWGHDAPSLDTSDSMHAISPSSSLLSPSTTTPSTSAAFESLKRHAQLVHNALRTVHEGTSPKYTSTQRGKYVGDSGESGDSTYGGITGTITFSGFVRVLEVMWTGSDSGAVPSSAVSASTSTSTRDSAATVTLAPRFRMRPHESVFCDVGCGTGRPTLSAAGLPLRASLGFDVDPLQVFNSCAGWRLVESRVSPSSSSSSSSSSSMCPVGFFHGDAMTLATIAPVTHMYSFVGYDRIVFELARLAQVTPTVQTLAVVAVRDNEVRQSGLWDPHADTDVVVVRGLKMPAGNAYTGFVVPMTSQRRERVARTLAELALPRPTPSSTTSPANAHAHATPPRDLTAPFQASQTREGREQLLSSGLASLGERPARRQASRRALLSSSSSSS